MHEPDNLKLDGLQKRFKALLDNKAMAEAFDDLQTLKMYLEAERGGLLTPVGKIDKARLLRDLHMALVLLETAQSSPAQLTWRALFNKLRNKKGQ